MKTNRPKWAKQLTAREWKHLQESQNCRMPTLRNLKSDVEWQRKGCLRCWECESALRTAQGE